MEVTGSEVSAGVALFNAGVCWLTIDSGQPVARMSGVLIWTLSAVLLILGYVALAVPLSIAGACVLLGAHIAKRAWKRREASRSKSGIQTADSSPENHPKS